MATRRSLNALSLRDTSIPPGNHKAWKKSPAQGEPARGSSALGLGAKKARWISETRPALDCSASCRNICPNPAKFTRGWVDAVNGGAPLAEAPTQPGLNSRSAAAVQSAAPSNVGKLFR